MKTFACAVAAALCAQPATVAAQSQPLAKPQPPKSRGMDDETRGFLGGLAGIGSGALLGLLGFGVTLAVIRDKDGCPDFCDWELDIATVGGQLGMSAGFALTINAIGDHRDGHGSLGVSMTGAVVGGGISWLLTTTNADLSDGAWFGIFFALPFAGALGGYWATHEHTGVTVVPTGNGLALSGRF